MSGRIENLYHIGIVVEDFDATCAQMSRTDGAVWSPTIETDLAVWTIDAGMQTYHFKAAYSVAAPHLEIVQAIPGTMMAATPGKPIHHLGYWTDDLTGDSERLERLGHPRVLCAMENGKLYGYAYHRTPDGLYQEIVDRKAFPDWKGFLTGTFKFESKVV